MLPMEEVLKETAKLSVSYIVFGGYYSNNDDGYELNEHTDATLILYKKGYESYEGDISNIDTVFNGVCFEENKKPLAEWVIDGEVTYFELCQ